MDSLLSGSISAAVAGVAGIGLWYNWRSWRLAGQEEVMSEADLQDLRRKVQELPFYLKKGPLAAQLHAAEDPKYALWMGRYAIGLSALAFVVALVLLFIWLAE